MDGLEILFGIDLEVETEDVIQCNIKYICQEKLISANQLEPIFQKVKISEIGVGEI